MCNQTQRVLKIVKDGNFCRSSSSKTMDLHIELRGIMSSLAPCQLPEFLVHRNKWVREYASERLERDG